MNAFIPFSNPVAFAPFYRECVVVRGGSRARRHIAASLKACVLDCGLADPVAEDDSETDIRTVEVSFPQDAWPFTEPPQTGDAVDYDGTRFAVSSVSRRLGAWCLKARQSKGQVWR